MKKYVSWNVNGLRAILAKDFLPFFKAQKADCFGVQEIKCQEGQVELELPGYYQSWSYAEKRGYAGTAIFSKEKPLQVLHGIGLEEVDKEGRICAAEFEDCWFISLYSINSQEGLARLGLREEWDAKLTAFLDELAKNKPVIVGGDFNVAHEAIDLAHPKENEGKTGYTEVERNDFSRLLASGFIDTFRYLYPNKTDVYTWWSYRERARLTNAGWRLDYFLVSDALKDKIQEATILDSVEGSDHAPITLTLS